MIPIDIDIANIKYFKVSIFNRVMIYSTTYIKQWITLEKPNYYNVWFFIIISVNIFYSIWIWYKEYILLYPFFRLTLSSLRFIQKFSKLSNGMGFCTAFWGTIPWLMVIWPFATWNGITHKSITLKWNKIENKALILVLGI